MDFESRIDVYRVLVLFPAVHILHFEFYKNDRIHNSLRWKNRTPRVGTGNKLILISVLFVLLSFHLSMDLIIVSFRANGTYFNSKCTQPLKILNFMELRGLCVWCDKCVTVAHGMIQTNNRTQNTFFSMKGNSPFFSVAALRLNFIDCKRVFDDTQHMSNEHSHAIHTEYK